MQGLTAQMIWQRHGIRPSHWSGIEKGRNNLTAWTAVRSVGVHPWDFYVPRERAPSLQPRQQEHPLQAVSPSRGLGDILEENPAPRQKLQPPKRCRRPERP